MIITLLLSCAVIAFLYYYVIHLARFRRLLNLIPGPPMLPIIGDPLVFLQYTREDLFQILITRFKKYAPVWKVWSFMLAFVSISHPDDMQTIMTNMKYNTKGRAYKFFKPWLRDGLLVSKGTKWQERRKILTPTFHFNILKNFFDILIEESNRMTKSINDMDDSTMKNLASFISHHTLNIICETSMGISLQNVSELEQKQYRKAIHDMGELIIYRLMRPWFHINMIFALTPTYRKQTKCLKILHGFTEKIIAERKQYHESTGGRYLNFENDAEAENEKIGGRKKRLAMLDLMIVASNNNQMNDLDIREEVDTFMFEGHDTVAMALTYSILLLAEHKEIQDRVRNEVNAVIEENGGKLIMAALQNLEYLERCLKETMRLYPSVFYITRQLEDDVKLQSCVVPAGVELEMDIYNLHRNPDFWPNPEMFDPDRFLPDLVKDRHPFVYIPFSAGSRNCIGQRFAMMELKTVIATLVRNFYLEPIDYLKDMRIQADIILRSMHPLRVRFVPIENA